MAKTDFKVIDISMKITNQLPMVRITDDLVVTVNNRKNTILNVQVMAAEAEKKKDSDNEMGFITKALKCLLAKRQQIRLRLWTYRFRNIRKCIMQ